MVSLLTKIESAIYTALPRKIQQKLYSRTMYSYSNLKIYIHDSLFFRSLDFGGSATQSKVCKIYKTTPILATLQILYFAGILYKLVNCYDKSNNNIFYQNILILGLGGGDLLRCYHKLFNQAHLHTKITVIEKSPEIIEIANQFFYLDKFKSTSLLTIDIKESDAFDYICSPTYEKSDIIVVDFFTELNSALQLLDETYVKHLYEKLSSNGLIVFNVLISDQTLLNQFITLLNNLFNQQLLVITSDQHYNTVLFCFNNAEYISSLSMPENYQHAFEEFITTPKKSNVSNDVASYWTAKYQNQ